MRRLAAAVLSAGLLLGSGLTACGDQGSATSAGDVVVGHASHEVTGDSAFVLLPTGRVDLNVGDPTERLTDEQVEGGRRAPDGGSFLPVSWTHDPFGETGVPIGVIGAEPQEAEVTLVAGETRADLGSPYRVVGETGTTDPDVSTMYVALDQAPDEVGDVSFEVTYDGLTQTVSPATGQRDAGVGAALYDEPMIGVEAPCTSEGFATSRVQPDVSCVVNAPQRSPYLPGHGWAEEGRTFVLLTAFFTVDSVEVRGSAHDVDAVTPRLTLDGADPLPPDGRFGEPELHPGAASGTWAFDAAGDGVGELAISLDGVLDDGGDVTLQQTVPLG